MAAEVARGLRQASRVCVGGGEREPERARFVAGRPAREVDSPRVPVQRGLQRPLRLVWERGAGAQLTACGQLFTPLAREFVEVRASGGNRLALVDDQQRLRRQVVEDGRIAGQRAIERGRRQLAAT